MSPRDPPAAPTRRGDVRSSGAFADLWWLPVGAGGHVVVHTSRWWERWRALRERRGPRPLFHAALEVAGDEERYVIEMAPAWGSHAGSRGVVATGPVGMRVLGRSRLFRYEIRCRDDGVLPDREYAPEPPRRLPLEEGTACDIRGRLRTAPLHVWGRDPFGAGDMWNSNSLIAWLLETSGVDTRDLRPPRNGVAPGWIAGLVAARAHGTSRVRSDSG